MVERREECFFRRKKAGSRIEVGIKPSKHLKHLGHDLRKTYYGEWGMGKRSKVWLSGTPLLRKGTRARGGTNPGDKSQPLQFTIEER